MAFCLVDLNKSFTFASDDESQKRLVARHRVFFDANYSRTRRLEQSLIRNPQNPKSPELPLNKEKPRILTKLRKNERTAKGKTSFSFHADLVDVSDIAKVISIMAAKARVAAVVDEE